MTSAIPYTSTSPARQPRHAQQLIWTLTLILVTIGLLAVVRRTYVLLNPQPASPRFAGAALDAGFARHAPLTLMHILPASLFMGLAPLQFLSRIRQRRMGWHRWLGRALVILGGMVGASALMMSRTMTIGGVSETAATTLFAILFLVFLSLGFWNIRRHRVVQHREWMIRAVGVALGIATTRPIIGAFFATGQLSPRQFFGTAFWLGFTLTLAGAEVWIRYSRTLVRQVPRDVDNRNPLASSDE